MAVKKSKSESEKYNQARRILNIYRLFLSNRILTTKDIFKKIREYYEDVSYRTIQRDLKILRDEDFIILDGKGKYSSWKINQINTHRTESFNIRENELLSFYILKSYLNTFKGTKIEENITELSDKLETLVPGEVIMEEQFYGDQNIGYYNYSGKHQILSKCIQHITEKNWIKIVYEKQTKDETKEYDIFPQFLYTYSGTIYLLEKKKKRKRNTTFIVQNIRSIEKIWDETRTEPGFDYNDFRNQRFAVFDGRVRKVKLKINKDFRKYFENRSWHPTQKTSSDNQGNMILEMKVPLTPDLTSWICRWAEIIIVLHPRELKDIVRSKHEKALENY
mgnify:FL=1